MNTDCLCCLEEITKSNFVKYKFDLEAEEWLESKYCKDCVILLLNTQWKTYLDGLKDDCKKTVKNLIISGPPINIKDKDGFPGEDNKEVQILYYDDSEQRAKLNGTLEGEDREKYWNELKSLLEHLDV